MLEETHPSSTRTQILDRETDSRRIEKTHTQTDRQTGRVRGEGDHKKKRDMRRGRDDPHTLIYNPSACRWKDGNKEGGEKRETNGGQGRKNERTRVGAYKTNPRPARDWHLVTVTSSSRPRHTRQTHR